MGRRGRELEERDPFENESLPTRRGHDVAFGRFDPEPLEERLVDRSWVRARVERQLETPQESGRVLGPLGDEDELLGRIGDADLGERPGKLVVAGDIEREFRAAIPQARLAASSRSTG